MKIGQLKITTSILCVFLLLNSLNVISQEFAPVGAKWYYSYTWPYMQSLMIKMESIAVEEINGIECKKLVTTEYLIVGNENHLDSVTRSIDYYYKDNNRIYHYDQFTDDFYALYDFNGIPGDTTIVRDTIIDDCYDWNLHPIYYYCSNFSYAVDSVDSIDINGYNLKLLHTSSCWETFGDEDWYFSHPNDPTPIIENIGSVLFWFGKWLTTNGTNEITGLRCYEDENMFYRSPDWPEPYPCDSIPQVYYTSINNSSPLQSMKIHPNPAKTDFTVSLRGYDSGTELRLFNISGQLVKTMKITRPSKHYNFDVSDLPGGMYIISLYSKSKGAFVEKKKLIIENN